MTSNKIGESIVKVLLGLPSSHIVDFNMDVQGIGAPGRINPYERDAHIAGIRLSELGGESPRPIMIMRNRIAAAYPLLTHVMHTTP